ncbi:fatty acid desaturase, partial [Albidovulum sp.]
APRRGAADRGGARQQGGAGPGFAGRIGVLRARLAPLRPFLPHLAATLGPVPLLVLGGLFGGVWAALALFWMAALYHLGDLAAMRPGRAMAGGAAGGAAGIGGGAEAAAAERVPVIVALVHFPVLAFAVWALAGGSGLGPGGWIATFIAAGLWFGQVSNAAAHELIHRPRRWPFRLGLAVYASLLFGHHASAHRLVHHRHVGTAHDPNTAEEGESFGAFLLRAWPGSFVAGYEMERNLCARAAARGIRRLHPYVIHLGLSAAVVAATGAAFGVDGVLALLLLAAHAQLQLMLSDYVQHYGLVRREVAPGRLEPVGPRHSWDAPHPFSGLMMLNATRHADHHRHPGRGFHELELAPETAGLRLPYPLGVMATIALVPPLWRRVMDRRLELMRRRGLL